MFCGKVVWDYLPLIILWIEAVHNLGHLRGELVESS